MSSFGVLAPHMMKNPFGLAGKQAKEAGFGMMQGGMNPLLAEKEAKEKGFTPEQPKVPWMDQDVFGMNRGNLMYGGLGLLANGRMF